MFCDLDLATDMKTGIGRMGSLTLGLVKQVCALMRIINSDRKSTRTTIVPVLDSNRGLWTCSEQKQSHNTRITAQSNEKRDG